MTVCSGGVLELLDNTVLERQAGDEIKRRRGPPWRPANVPSYEIARHWIDRFLAVSSLDFRGERLRRPSGSPVPGGAVCGRTACTVLRVQQLTVVVCPDPPPDERCVAPPPAPPELSKNRSVCSKGRSHLPEDRRSPHRQRRSGQAWGGDRGEHRASRCGMARFTGSSFVTSLHSADTRRESAGACDLTAGSASSSKSSGKSNLARTSLSAPARANRPPDR